MLSISCCECHRKPAFKKNKSGWKAEDTLYKENGLRSQICIRLSFKGMHRNLNLQGHRKLKDTKQ